METLGFFGCLVEKVIKGRGVSKIEKKTDKSIQTNQNWSCWFDFLFSCFLTNKNQTKMILKNLDIIVWYLIIFFYIKFYSSNSLFLYYCQINSKCI